MFKKFFPSTKDATLHRESSVGAEAQPSSAAEGVSISIDGCISSQLRTSPASELEHEDGVQVFKGFGM